MRERKKLEETSTTTVKPVEEKEAVSEEIVTTELPQQSTEAAPSPTTIISSTTQEIAPSTEPTTELSTAVPIEEVSLQVVDHDFDTETQFITLRLNQALQPGSKYRVYLKYQGFLSDSLSGFYRVAYTKRNKKTRYFFKNYFERVIIFLF